MCGSLPGQRINGRALGVPLVAGDTAAGHAKHAITHCGDGCIVRDQGRGRAERRVHVGKRMQHETSGFRVERAGWFVAEENVRPLGDRARIATRCCSPPDI
jgi:hypothetical protein